jgi:uncharacterized membrane protein
VKFIFTDAGILIFFFNLSRTAEKLNPHFLLARLEIQAIVIGFTNQFLSSSREFSDVL